MMMIVVADVVLQSGWLSVQRRLAYCFGSDTCGGSLFPTILVTFLIFFPSSTLPFVCRKTGKLGGPGDCRLVWHDAFLFFIFIVY